MRCLAKTAEHDCWETRKRADQVVSLFWCRTCYCVGKELVPQVCRKDCHTLVHVTAVVALHPLSEGAVPKVRIDSMACFVEKRSNIMILW